MTNHRSLLFADNKHSRDFTQCKQQMWQNTTRK